LVCIAKCRRKIFDAATLEWLAGHALAIFAKMDFRLLASRGEADHLHILLDYPPKLSVSVPVNAFKGTSKPEASQEPARLVAMVTVFCGRRPLSLRRPAALRCRSLSCVSSNRAGALPPRPKARLPPRPKARLRRAENLVASL
jgi:REP element-mobilizing transposase RayT